jgi:hypothetical protein
MRGDSVGVYGGGTELSERIQKRKAVREKLSSSMVGIFWVVRGKLITLGIPASEGKNYGDYAIYEPSHYEKWNELQRSGAVPPECEYEEFPRGRVMFHARDAKYLLLADRCILGDKKMVTHIMQELNLPEAKTTCDRDSHYRCFRCLGYYNEED